MDTGTAVGPSLDDELFPALRPPISEDDLSDVEAINRELRMVAALEVGSGGCLSCFLKLNQASSHAACRLRAVCGHRSVEAVNWALVHGFVATQQAKR